MPDPWSTASGSFLFSRIGDLLGAGSYLVGGAVRDLLLGREPSDYDLLTFGDVSALSRDMGARLGCSPFWLDKERQVMRLVLKSPALVIDVAAPKGPDLEADLRARDLTLNALALTFPEGRLVDPCGGAADLQRGVIRGVAEKNIADDPLRVMRVVRFAVQFGFAVDAHTLSWCRTHAPQLEAVAGERIRQELFWTLAVSGGGERAWRLLVDTGIAAELMGRIPDLEQGHHHRYTLHEHLYRCVRAVDDMLADPGQVLSGAEGYFSREVEVGVSRGALLRFVAFVHDIGKPVCVSGSGDETHFHGHASAGREQVSAVMRRLRCSTRVQRMAVGLVGEHMRLLQLDCGPEVSGRALHRLCRAAEGFLPELLLLAVADAEATGVVSDQPGSAESITALARDVWSYAQSVYDEQRRSPLITGRDILACLDVTPGAWVGDVLRIVEEERADGRVSTRDEALALAREILPSLR